MTSRGVGTGPDERFQPRFSHGENLCVVATRTGKIRFQSADGAYVAADCVVYVDDWA